MAHLDPETLSAHIDHELSPEQDEQVDQHLASCAECRQEYQELRGLSALVRNLPVYAPKRVIEINEAQDVKPTALSTMIEFSRPLALAAILILVAFAGLRLVTDSDNETDDGQISFSEVQEAPIEDGTETASDASVRIAEDQEATTESQPLLASGDTEESESQIAQEMLESECGEDAAAPAEVEQEAPDATIQPAADLLPEDEAGDEDSWIRLTASIVLAAVVIGGGAWLLLYRTPRRP